MHPSLARVAAFLLALSLFGAPRQAAAGFDDPIYGPGFSFKLDYNWDGDGVHGNASKTFTRGDTDLSFLEFPRSTKTLAQAKAAQTSWFKKHGYRLGKAATTTVDGRPAVIVGAVKMGVRETWGLRDTEDTTGPMEVKSRSADAFSYLAIIFMNRKGVATGYFISALSDVPLDEIVRPILDSTRVK